MSDSGQGIQRINIMNRLINILFRYGLSALLVLIVFSSFLGCKKDKLDLYQEVANEFSNYLSTTIGSGTAMKLGDSAVNNRTLSAPGLPVLLQKEATQEVVVQGTIDPSLVAVYDSLNHTKSPVFKEGAFELSNKGVIYIESGLSTSTDSLKLHLKNASLLEHNTIYLVPIKLKVVSGQAQLKSKYMFVKMKVSITPSLIQMDVYKPESGLNTNFIRGYYVINGYHSVTKINNQENGIKVFKFSARINHPLDIAVQGGIRLNNTDSVKTWVEGIKKNTYNRIPESAIKIIKPTVNFPKGDSVSVDSFAFSIDYQQLKQSDKNYIGILELENTSNNNFVEPMTELGANYALIEINIQEYNTENIAYPLPALQGNKMDRSLWKATAEVNDNNKDFPVTNLFDGKIATIWKAAGSTPKDITIDMGKTETLKGFIFSPSYLGSYDIYYNFSKVEAYSSNDGKTWKKEGIFIAGDIDNRSTADRPDRKNLKFINPVTAKFFKFNIIESSFGLPYISEIEGIN